jgi:hypothetical protein
LPVVGVGAVSLRVQRPSIQQQDHARSGRARYLVVDGPGIPTGCRSTRAVTFSEAPETASRSLPRSGSSNRIADELRLGQTGRRRELAQRLDFFVVQVHRRLVHALYMVPPITTHSPPAATSRPKSAQHPRAVVP